MGAVGNFISFDVADAQLNMGVHLVEAGAGTGKTYSIAMLVLRFVVEKGVPVESILVVTYTRAATEELRARIRARLVEARDILVCGPAPGSDPVLVRYLENVKERRLALGRIRQAVLDMDRAAVFTIHGFCQRMLQEQALESGQLFDMELCPDVSGQRRELVDDFWRKTMYSLSPLHCSLLLHEFPDPDSLYESVSKVGSEDIIVPGPEKTLAESLAAADESLVMLKAWWYEHSRELGGRFIEAVRGKMFKKQFNENFATIWNNYEAFLSGGSDSLPENLVWLTRDGLMAELNGNRLRGDGKKEEFLSEWPLADRAAEKFVDDCGRAVLGLRVALALEMQAGLRHRLERQGLFSFDDLVLNLAERLADERGDVLRRLLVERFQVALIDEFQDTDAAQYTIFSSLFGKRSHYLFLIGDPKQAIYRFRGADIYAYFAARRSADVLFKLSVNYRSNPLLMGGVNSLFSQRADAFVAEELPYNSLEAATPCDFLRITAEHGKVEDVMIYCSLDSPDGDETKSWSSGGCLERLQNYVAREITELLNCKKMVNREGRTVNIGASDIAILVRSHKQAEAFQRTLSLACIPSVVSSRKTVFETAEYVDLLNVLAAVASPSSTRLLRTAMACRWFGMDGRKFYDQSMDEELLNGWRARFYTYHAMWLDRGILAMMNALIEAESVFTILSGEGTGQRQIANIIHLLEIIQEEEAKQGFSISQTMRYLQRVKNEKDGADYAQLRLESDDAAVKIVTMHAVKGLEYPVVFCPCLWYRPVPLGRKHCVRFHDEDGRISADLGSELFARRKTAITRDDLAEEMRLLYVAVTRGSCRTYLFWADVKGSSYTMASTESAFSWALQLENFKGISAHNLRIKEICDLEGVAFRAIEDSDSDNYHGGVTVAVPETFFCRHFSGFPLDSERLLTSYSALAGAVEHGDSVLPDPDSGAAADEIDAHDLPRGAAFGNLVHGVLEDYPYAVLAGDGDLSEALLSQCRRFGVQCDIDKLEMFFRNVTRTPLGVTDGKSMFSLADLKEEDVLKEMGFYYRLRKNTVNHLNDLLAPCTTVRPVQAKDLQGYLTGFVDLICRSNGRYYVLDYKSNYLGDFLHDYGKDRMEEAMYEHNYGLQYWLYSLVLHRYLKRSIGDYSHEELFGGVFYLFARGMRPDQPGSGVFFDRPGEETLERLHEILGEAG